MVKKPKVGEQALIAALHDKLQTHMRGVSWYDKQQVLRVQRSGLSQSTLSRIEAGASTRSPTIAQVFQWLYAANLTAADINAALQAAFDAWAQGAEITVKPGLHRGREW